MSVETSPKIPPQVFEVCTLITLGVSVQDGCAQLGISTATFYEALRNSETVEKEYMRARETRADVRFEKMQDLLDDIKAKRIDPNAARVIMDAIKWQCGKEKAKVYGDSTILRGDKDNPLDLGLAKLLDVAGTLRKDLPVIDGEATAIDAMPAIEDNT